MRVYAWWVQPLRPIAPALMPLHHKGFDIVVHAEEAPQRFRYEILHRERALVTSPVAYASETEAVRAARVFVEGVDRLLGLDPPEREG